VSRHRPGPVVTNLSTSRLLDDIAAAAGVVLERVPVGEINKVELENGHAVVTMSIRQKYADLIKAALPDSFVATASLSYIRASVAGCLGIMKFLGGDRADVSTFAPRYLRLSEAERKLSTDDVPEYKKVDKP